MLQAHDRTAHYFGILTTFSKTNRIVVVIRPDTAFMGGYAAVVGAAAMELLQFRCEGACA